MKNAVTITLAGFCLATSGLVHAFATVQECRASNTKVLADVEAQRKVAKLTTQQDAQYQTLWRSAVSRDSIAERQRGNELRACEGQSNRIATLQQGLTAMMPPAMKVGDRAKGGIVFNVTDFGQHGLVAQEQDCNTKWFRISWQAATSECATAKGGFNDWYLPSSGELALLYQAKAAVPNLRNEAYWSSTKLTFGPMKEWDNQVYFVSMADGSSIWAYVNDNGPNRALFNSRAIRKF
jgi:hypothetical protein